MSIYLKLLACRLIGRIFNVPMLYVESINTGDSLTSDGSQRIVKIHTTYCGDYYIIYNGKLWFFDCVRSISPAYAQQNFTDINIFETRATYGIAPRLRTGYAIQSLYLTPLSKKAGVILSTATIAAQLEQ